MLKTLVLIADTPHDLLDGAPAEQCQKLKHSAGQPTYLIGSDYRQEWEDRKTVLAIAEQWKALGFNVEILELDAHFLHRFHELTKTRPEQTLIHSLVEGWGSTAREAWLPSLCELAGLVCIGSKPAAFSLCMDKDATLHLAASLGIRVPQGSIILSIDDYRTHLASTGAAEHFLKPNAEGSGLGITASSRRPQGVPMPEHEVEELLLRFPDGLRAEEWIDGDDWTTGLVGNETMLPIARIRVEGSIYGAEHKRKDAMTEEVDFPELPSAVSQSLETASRKLWHRFGLADMARMDWKLTAAGEPVLLEVNPLPGLSPYYSVLPLMWQHMGRSYSELLSELMHSAQAKAQGPSLVYGRHIMRTQVGN
jgi:D-alanine--D-alanine ligase